METNKRKLLFFMITLPFSSYGNANEIKPDITVDIRKPMKAKSWDRQKCCSPAILPKNTKLLFEEKVFTNQDFMKLSDILHNFWQEYSHKR